MADVWRIVFDPDDLVLNRGKRPAWTMPSRPSARWRQSLTPNQFDLSIADRFTAGQNRALSISEWVIQGAALVAALLRFGLRRMSDTLAIELGVIVVGGLFLLLALLVLRDHGSLTRETFRSRHRVPFLLLMVWLGVSVAILVFGPGLLGFGEQWTRFSLWFRWSDLVIVARAFLVVIRLVRGVTAEGLNPAWLLVGSFGLLILLGTSLLMLPKCHASDAPQYGFYGRVRICLFTATSATCVTGLVVVPTGGPDAYWSTTGQFVIMGLIQVGGLGIMTCGAFFALTGGQAMRLRETETLRELLDSEQTVNVRQLLVAILVFTFGSELIGGLFLTGLWPELPWGERLFRGMFHAVSAFCNAGFDLQGTSLVGLETRWQTWGVIPTLVILGGIGFGVLFNLAHVTFHRLRRRRLTPWEAEATYRSRLRHYRPVRLTMTTRLVLITTGALLVSATAWYFFFEAAGEGVLANQPIEQRLSHAWIQSVVFRTAGFNSVDLNELRPASKLVAVVLMFIGGSPISTGGGVKTITLAVTILGIVSLMRGRPRTEAFGRTLPDDVTRRALAVIAIGMATLFVVTLLLAVFEDQSEIPVIDLLFQAASACATVGASTMDTGALTHPSQFVLIVAMFLGRVGPLTLLLGLARQRHAAVYSYPEERVTLG